MSHSFREGETKHDYSTYNDSINVLISTEAALKQETEIENGFDKSEMDIFMF